MRADERSGVLRSLLRLAGPAIPLLAALGAACDKGPAEPKPPRPSASSVPSASASASSETRPSRETAPPELPDPEALRVFRAHLAEPAVPFVAMPPPVVTKLALENSLRGEAVGMRAEGGIHVVRMRGGERATLPVQIPKGGCVAFVANGGLGIIEVDLFLTEGSGTDARVIAQDAQGGPIAVIGGRGKCIKNVANAPLAAEFHVSVRQGSGVVLVQELRPKP